MHLLCCPCKAGVQELEEPVKLLLRPTLETLTEMRFSKRRLRPRPYPRDPDHNEKFGLDTGQDRNC